MKNRIISLISAAVMTISVMPQSALVDMASNAAAKHMINLTTSYSYDFENELLAVEVDMTKNEGFNSGSFHFN